MQILKAPDSCALIWAWSWFLYLLKLILQLPQLLGSSPFNASSSMSPIFLCFFSHLSNNLHFPSLPFFKTSLYHTLTQSLSLWLSICDFCLPTLILYASLLPHSPIMVCEFLNNIYVSEICDNVRHRWEEWFNTNEILVKQCLISLDPYILIEPCQYYYLTLLVFDSLVPNWSH